VIEGSAAQRSGVLVYAAPTLDITADFVREYNKANPVAAAKARLPNRRRISRMTESLLDSGARSDNP
jgi:hypothetical protein